MKLVLWYEHTKKPYGGSNQFLRRLGSAISNLGHEVSWECKSGTEAILVNSFVSGPGRRLNVGQVAQAWATGRVNLFGRLPGASKLYLRRFERRGPPIFHRVDGVTALYGRNTPEVDHLTVDINHFADMTIFQSAFCRESFLDFGMRPKASVVINNGVPLDIFYPRPSSIPPGKILKLAAVSWSSNLMKGFSTLAELSLLANVSLTFVGNWPKSIAPQGVQVIGQKTEREIAAILREHDAFVHAAINEPSSNAIIEALASGLPVLFRDSGGNRELVQACGLALDDDLKTSVDTFRVQYMDLRKRALAERYRFSIQSVAKQYLEVISRTSDKLSE